MDLIRQSLFLPAPAITGANCPDQTGRVHLITGGYGGIGLELCKLLYAANATVIIAGRSASKAEHAIGEIKTNSPGSKGSVSFVEVDFGDLATIKPAAESVLSQHSKLHVLTLNHGILSSPADQAMSKQGHEIHMAVNCLGSHLFYALLRPALVAAAKEPSSAPGSVRVTWPSSLAVDMAAPKGGITFVPSETSPTGEQPTSKLSEMALYGQSKAGNVLLARVQARRDKGDAILHLAFHPGMLKSELLRHQSAFGQMLTSIALHDTIYGAYTELFAALGDVGGMEQSGKYIWPWGRLGYTRKDVEAAADDANKDGVGERFVRWVEACTKDYA